MRQNTAPPSTSPGRAVRRPRRPGATARPGRPDRARLDIGAATRPRPTVRGIGGRAGIDAAFDDAVRLVVRVSIGTVILSGVVFASAPAPSARMRLRAHERSEQVPNSRRRLGIQALRILGLTGTAS